MLQEAALEKAKRQKKNNNNNKIKKNKDTDSCLAANLDILI